jgi:hypothetical protein
MKKLLPVILAFSFFSCVSTYYQVSEIRTNPAQMQSNNTYEDSAVKISYNFWSTGGVIKFTLYNKLNVPIYINWERSNFILNGQSTEYTENTTISIPQGGYLKTMALASANGSEHFVSIANKEQISSQLPPHSYISVNKFALNEPYFDIGHFPKAYDSITYSAENSILHFRNYIGYTTDQNLSNLKFIDNEFWVGKITTMNGKYFDENHSVPNEYYSSFERD